MSHRRSRRATLVVAAVCFAGLWLVPRSAPATIAEQRARLPPAAECEGEVVAGVWRSHKYYPQFGDWSIFTLTIRRSPDDRNQLVGRITNRNWGGGAESEEPPPCSQQHDHDWQVSMDGRGAVRDETPGLVIGARERTMGSRAIPEAEIRFEDMAVAGDAVVMPPRGFAKGFADLMNAYNTQRIGAATVALGIAQGAFDQALAYTKEREQFGRPIYEFQGLQWMLADMSIQLEAARAMIWRAVASANGGFPDVLQAAQAKVFAADMAIKVTNDALRLFGAAGYSQSRPLERMVRDARMFAIAGGTAQILRTVVASRLLGERLPQSRDGYSELVGRQTAGARRRSDDDEPMSSTSFLGVLYEITASGSSQGCSTLITSCDS
jgi:hypothetical protein